MTSFNRREFVAATLASSLPFAQAQTAIIMNDASKLNPTPVFKHFSPKKSSDEAFIAALRQELKEAKTAKRPVAIGAARHSMNGQSLAKNGTTMTFDINSVEIDSKAKIYQVHAGTRWFEVMESLNAAKLSPKVMQSNSDFGIASTFSVNAHGWPCPYGPFGSTVRSIRLMLASGEILSCSRTQNAELFQLAMGGYGMMGVILSLEVEATDNALYSAKFEKVAVNDFAAQFIKSANNPAIKMIYGRLNVARNDFMTDSLLVTFNEVKGEMPPLSRGGGFMSTLSNKVYRSQISSEAAKKARWVVETKLSSQLTSGKYNRNSLMDEPVSILAGNEKNRTDILHEYFVAPERFNDFVEACRRIIPKAKAEFLNVTLRYIAKDHDSVMNFATTDRIAAVMSFSQETTPEGEEDMIKLSQSMIEAMGGMGGAFYLPYRLHASPTQLRKIYTRTDEFMAKKRHYDPDLLFRNGFWETYNA